MDWIAVGFGGSRTASRLVAESPCKDDSLTLVGPGLVLEQLQHGVRPIRDVVERLSVANRHEARHQGVELLPGQRFRRRLGLRRVHLGAPVAGETNEPLASGAGRLGELVEQLVDAGATLRRQGRKRLRQVFAVVIRGRRAPSSSRPAADGLFGREDRASYRATAGSGTSTFSASSTRRFE